MYPAWALDSRGDRQAWPHPQAADQVKGREGAAASCWVLGTLGTGDQALRRWGQVPEQVPEDAVWLLVGRARSGASCDLAHSGSPASGEMRARSEAHPAGEPRCWGGLGITCTPTWLALLLQDEKEVSQWVLLSS